MAAAGFLRASDVTRELGVSVRALRVYERHGLVRPARNAAGWRAYAPADLANIRRVIALKQVGLKLAQIARLMAGDAGFMDRLLGLQEAELIRRKRDDDRALVLIREARRRICATGAMPLDAFVTLTRETHMVLESPEYKSLWSKHVDMDKVAALHPGWSPEIGLQFKSRWLDLVAEAERLKDSDPAAAPALDLARRALALVGEFTRYDSGLMASLKSVFAQGFAKAETADRMPYSEGVWHFMNAAVKNLHAAEK